jgi:hypothetical protein
MGHFAPLLFLAACLLRLLQVRVPGRNEGSISLKDKRISRKDGRISRKDRRKASINDGIKEGGK